MPRTKVSAILQAERRIRASGFGRLTVGASHVGLADHGTIHVQPTPAERDDLAAFLERLMTELDFRYNRDQLELSYEHGHLTLAKITFPAL